MAGHAVQLVEDLPNMHQAARPVLSNTYMQAWCFEPVISELRSWRQDQSSRASAATIVCLSVLV